MRTILAAVAVLAVVAGLHAAQNDTPVANAAQAGNRAAVKSLLVLAPQTVLMLPVEAWKFSEATPHFPADGMLQGAALEYGLRLYAMEADWARWLVKGIDTRGRR